MDFVRSFIFLLALGSTNGFAAQIISSQAGKVGSIAVTTRQVAIHSLLENAIGRENPVTLNLNQTGSREFIREATATLVENAVYLESVSFNTAAVREDEIPPVKKKILAALKNNKNWKALEVSDKELNEAIERKMRAKKFIQFKVDSSSIPISEKEMRDYYDSNRVRFDEEPFEKHKASIKEYLNRNQVDRRLRDWFDLLHAKYKIRNYLSRE